MGSYAGIGHGRRGLRCAPRWEACMPLRGKLPRAAVRERKGPIWKSKVLSGKQKVLSRIEKVLFGVTLIGFRLYIQV